MSALGRSALGRDKHAEVVSDALGLLKRDHRLIAAQFLEFELASPQQLDPLARRICKMLRIHTQVEEELFYPIARSVAARAASVDEAEAGHAQMKQHLTRIESLTSDQPALAETVALLGALVREHIAEEETILFPELVSSNVSLVGLGLALLERRDTLMRVMGLNDDDEIPALRQLTETADRPLRPPAGVAPRPRSATRRQ